MDEKQILETLLEMLAEKSKAQHPANCGCMACSNCTTEPMFESSMATFQQRANNVAAAAMEQFQERVNVQSAAMIRMQADITLDKRTE